MKPVQRLYRVRCADAIHSEWLETDDEAWAIAMKKGLAYEHHDGIAGLGPLTWIETKDE